jgi:hypothetical protein
LGFPLRSLCISNGRRFKLDNGKWHQVRNAHPRRFAERTTRGIAGVSERLTGTHPPADVAWTLAAQDLEPPCSVALDRRIRRDALPCTSRNRRP